MIEFLKSWIFNIIALVMFLLLLEIILPSGKLKKIVNLVSGFILIIALVEPFAGDLLKKKEFEDFQVASRKMIDEKELQYNSRIMEEEQMKQVTEIYKKKLTESIVQRLEKVEGITDIEAEVLIDDDFSSSTYGEIKKVFVKFKVSEEKDLNKNKETTIFQVEKISVKGGNKDNSRNKGYDGQEYGDWQKAIEGQVNTYDEKIQEQVEEIISRLFEVDSEDIIISIEKS